MMMNLGGEGAEEERFGNFCFDLLISRVFPVRSGSIIMATFRVARHVQFRISRMSSDSSIGLRGCRF